MAVPASLQRQDSRTRSPRRRAGWVGVAAALAALALVAAACGSSSKSAKGTTTTSTPSASATTSAGSTGQGAPSGVPGLTANTITVGQITTVSGPVPGLFQGANNGLDAWAAYINSKGGIAGRTVKVVHRDDALDCNNYKTALQSLEGQVFAMVGTFTIEDGCGQSVLQANPTFPNIEGYLLNPALNNVPNALTPTPQPPGYTTTGAIWIKNKFPHAITHTADLYGSVSQASYVEISDAYKSVGFKYVYTRGTNPLETNFTSDVLRMKAAGVQMVTLEAQTVNAVADFIQQADQQNFHPVIVSAQAYDAKLFKLTGSANADNLYMPLLYPMYLGQDRATNPALANMLNWLNRTHPGATPDIYTVEAWASGELFAQALQSAGSNPTRQGTINGVHGITAFTANGLLPVSNPGQRKSPTCMVIVGVKGTSFTRLDPPKQGYQCNGGYYYVPPSQIAGLGGLGG